MHSLAMESLIISILRVAFILSIVSPSLVQHTTASQRNELTPISETSLELLLTELQSAAYETFGETDFDPKLYVDLPLRTSLADAKAAFKALPRLSNGTIPSVSLKDYINEFFDAVGSDLIAFTPEDYTDEPESFLPLVKSQEARDWALKVHALWFQLSRKVSDDVFNEPDRHTLLPLPHPVVIPGSRFREVYYWDSYWIIRGLVVSRMFETAKGMVQNLLSLVELYGFVPNGARTYYINRSQPPLLSEMVRVVYESTSDLPFLQDAFPLLVREHKYWNSALHRVLVKDNKNRIHLLARYSANWNRPRPESFTIDEETVKYLAEEEKISVYREIASATETGWDFSSRWMENSSSLASLRTSFIVPVDLNAFLFQMERNLESFAKTLGEHKLAKHFQNAAEARRLAIDNILWDDEASQWFDFWLPTMKSNTGILKGVHSFNEGSLNHEEFPSNFIPLWCGILKEGDSRLQGILRAFTSSRLTQPFGVSTSLKNSTQQWDFPNAWPPLQHMIIEGFSKLSSSTSKSVARDIAKRWIQTTYSSYQETKLMIEKLDAQECGSIGGGGEYTTQAGFGWSNGVILALLHQYGWESNANLTCNQGHLEH